MPWLNLTILLTVLFGRGIFGVKSDEALGLCTSHSRHLDLTPFSSSLRKAMTLQRLRRSANTFLHFYLHELSFYQDFEIKCVLVRDTDMDNF